jgi:dihydroorotase
MAKGENTVICISNIRYLDGSLHRLRIAAAGQILEAKPQGKLLPPPGGALSLARYAELSSDPSWHMRAAPLEIDAAGEILAPAAIDAHVHSRDPGFPDKESWDTLAQAAYRGGVVAVVDMPNTFPPTLDRENIRDKAARADKSGLGYRFLLGVTAENLPRIPELLRDKTLPLCGLKIYYGQSTGNLRFVDLEQLAHKVPQLQDYMLVFHAEDQCRIDCQSRALSPEADYASVPSSYAVHSQIRDSESALQASIAILQWAQRWKRRVHIAHVSTPDEMALIAAARRDGIPVSCEVCPHHLLLSTLDYERLGGFLKVNPPVRSESEMLLLRRYLAEGSIDCFVTDHAPHTTREKRQPYATCPSGMPASEFFWPLFYHACKLSGTSAAALLPMVSSTPARLFGFPGLGQLAAGYAASFVWLREEEHTVTPESVAAHCGWSPYTGTRLPLRVQATWQEASCKFIA